jgi:hemerythrin
MSSGWNKELETGIHIIDGQHQEYFRRVDRFLSVCQADQEDKLFDQTYAFLGHYVVRHFKTEEGLMGDNAYPQSAPHIAQHRHFVKQLKEVIERSRADDICKESKEFIALSGLLIDWFQNHIRRMDILLTDFLKEKAKSKARSP